MLPGNLHDFSEPAGEQVVVLSAKKNCCLYFVDLWISLHLEGLLVAVEAVEPSLVYHGLPHSVCPPAYRLGPPELACPRYTP